MKNDEDTQEVTLTIDRDLYIRSIQAYIDIEKLLPVAIEAELKRIEAERKPISQEEIDVFIEKHKDLLTDLANR